MLQVKEARAVVEVIHGVHQCISGVLENYSGGVMLSSPLEGLLVAQLFQEQIPGTLKEVL